MKKIILIFLLFGCAAKKESTTKDVERVFIENKTVDYISSGIETSLTFPDLCNDDLKPRELFKEQKGTNYARIYKDSLNRLKIDLKTGLSQIKTDTIIKYRDKEIKVKDSEIRYKTPLWMWITIILSILINIILLRYTFFT